PRIKDLEKYRRGLRYTLVRVLPVLGPRLAADIRAADIASLRDQLTRALAPMSVRKCLACLGAGFGWAGKMEVRVKKPCSGVELPPRSSLTEWLSEEQALRLLEVARERAPAVYPMIATALYTGLRKGELFGLRWRDLDLETRRLDVMRSYSTLPKGNRPRHL